MKISDVRATTVAVPLEAPLRHANGAHWGRFVRTIVEVETDEGLIGLGEMGGGGEVQRARFTRSKAICLVTIHCNLNSFTGRYAIRLLPCTTTAHRCTRPLNLPVSI